MIKISICALLAAGLLVGCKKRSTETPASNKPAKPATAPSPSAAPSPTKPAVPAAPAVPPSPEIALRDLTAAARAFVMTQGKNPSSLDDLVKAGLHPKLPEPPQGKKYVLDIKTMSAVMVNN
ncbi:MAG: hypothetical protein WCS99_05770 [Limisphaerales bacterium]